MFCSKCGAEIDNGSKFCRKCGAMISTDSINQNESAIRPKASKQIDISKASNVVNEKIKAFKILPKKTRYIVLGISLFALICIIAIIKISTRDPIIGTWIEEWTFIDGVFSDNDPSYLTDRDPYKFSFYKDGSFRASGGYSWEDTTTGTWENVTTQADEYAQYTLTADGKSASFFKAQRNSLSWLVKGYGHDVIVFKKK